MGLCSIAPDLFLAQQPDCSDMLGFYIADHLNLHAFHSSSEGSETGQDEPDGIVAAAPLPSSRNAASKRT